MQALRYVFMLAAFLAGSLPAIADSTHDFAECTMDAIDSAGASPFSDDQSQEVDAAAAYLMACMVWDGYKHGQCWNKAECWTRSN